jgi:hypothetical protein
MAPLPQPTNVSNPYEKIRTNTQKIAKLQFPLDMGRYYIAFEFAEYGPRYQTGATGLVNGALNVVDFITQNNPLIPGVGITNTIAALSGYDPASVRMQTQTYGIGAVDAQIALPVPANLVDDQQLDYNAQNLLNVAAQGIAAGVGAVAPGAGAAIGRGASVAESINNFQSIFTGKTINPFLAMMFNGPRFKTHQFGWRFSPKTAAETTALVDIINTFKKNSLPMESTGIFTYPKVVLISLYPTSARDKMYKFKPAVIQQVSAHYAPSGTPSFFAGSNGPAEVEFKIQLSEISIWTSNDYSGGSERF